MEVLQHARTATKCGRKTSLEMLRSGPGRVRSCFYQNSVPPAQKSVLLSCAHFGGDGDGVAMLEWLQGDWPGGGLGCPAEEARAVVAAVSEEGYTTAAELAEYEMSEEDLRLLGFTKMRTRRRALAALQALRSGGSSAPAAQYIELMRRKSCSSGVGRGETKWTEVVSAELMCMSNTLRKATMNVRSSAMSDRHACFSSSVSRGGKEFMIIALYSSGTTSQS